ncbi:MAG: hypothetical protein IJZ42_01630 [Lachnospiraceae bacterium]|nr:hypothetical protein [Lachnospiraceae bacterium]
MKKVIFFLVIIVSVLSSCNIEQFEVSDPLADTPAEVPADNTCIPFEMELVGRSSEGRFFYYRDTVTDMMFLFCRSSTANSQGGGLTLMLDPETGLPLTYDRYMEIYGEQSKE